MPVGGGVMRTGGDMLEQKREIEKLLKTFERLVDEERQKRRLPPAVVRLCLECDGLIVQDKENIHIVARASQGMPSVLWLDKTEQVHTLQNVQSWAAWELGWEDTFAFSLPNDLLELPEEQWASDPRLIAAAEQLIDEEVRRRKRSVYGVKVKPIFGDPGEFQVNYDFCFVLMQIGKFGLDDIYNNIVKPAVEECGLVCKRADEIASNRAIMQDIWKCICEARIVIADLTGLNPNVFYELGIAHTLGKETILISRKAITDIPFDLYHIRRIEYENTAVGGQRLKEALIATIKEIIGSV